MSRFERFDLRKTLNRLQALALAGVLVACAGNAATAQDTPPRAMIVLDGSGSMWGQIDGEAKISIAQRVLDDVLRTTPRELHLGFMAYGHRRKGDCADIELMMMPAPGGTAEIAGIAEAIKPKGKTPLTDAVRQAAEALRYTEEKATVILITDGLETCRADPCALGAALEESGVDFTAHVVGFGLSPEEGRQVACLAENTGGQYIPAADADSLGDALDETVTQAAAPVAPPQPEPAPETLPEASIAGPDSIEIGKRFAVTWEGPGEKWDRVVLFDPSARDGEGKEFYGRRINRSGEPQRRVMLIAPVRPGTYKLQYRYSSRGHVIAIAEIDVVNAAVSLDAPANVSLGRDFQVTWIGPGARRDRIEIIDPQADGGAGKVVSGKLIRNGDTGNRMVTLTAPAEPGFYRLRYWNGDSRAELASRAIEVLPAQVSITAPDMVPMGTTFDAAWVGPGARKDRINILDASGKAVGGKRLVNGDFDNATVDLIAPAATGDYVLQYWNGDSRVELARRPITVVSLDVALMAPDMAPMGSDLTVEWAGPGASRDRIEIFDPAAKGGKGEVVSSRRNSNGDVDARTVVLKVPVRPGAYTLRYWNGDSNTVLAERALTVDAVTVSLDAPASVDAGGSFDVVWEGPGANRDIVQIVDGNGKVAASKRVQRGNTDARTVTLKAPDAGTYTLRYWNVDFTASLYEQPLTVN